MKAIASDALLIERVGQRKGLLDLGSGSVEGGIETGHLRQFGIEGHCHFDGREIVRLVQRRERHQLLQLGEQFRRDTGGSGVVQTAMDDAVAERVKPSVAEPLSGPRQYRREDLARHRRRCRT